MQDIDFVTVDYPGGTAIYRQEFIEQDDKVIARTTEVFQGDD